MSETILVTGGAGFIGSHLTAHLLDRDARVILLDDLSHGSEEAVRRAEQLGAGWAELVVGDCTDPDVVRGVFQRFAPDAVVHLAAAKSVAASVADPEGFRRTNIRSTEVLAEALLAHEVKRVVFASTAAVYGDTEGAAASEDSPLDPISPYAETKLEGERILDAAIEALGGSGVHLRFFNVCGAHPTGQLGEWVDRPENLMPILINAARAGDPVRIFGTDWPTRDGSCVRDYVHVMDIVGGIDRALIRTRRVRASLVCNLGTGSGSTVREVIAAVERACGFPLEVIEADRRPGDPAISTADASRAARLLDWRPVWDLDAMARHAWAWNPDG